MRVPHRTQGVRRSLRRYGRRARPDKKEPLRARARFVAWNRGPAAIRCAPSGPRPVLPGAQVSRKVPRRTGEAGSRPRGDVRTGRRQESGERSVHAYDLRKGPS
ncbi:hypothetical protein GCM10010339_25500 [Streptomyces alanosinicus]|uniref:Uncharacterized protein n=1 Tax=Streptomyces alanosinicus TaxID=68171 RepID=A0A919D2B2_9ACTN|nr:hypothetical protein GCM10010339_25500 [Streptomyces alanosinicus]